MSSFRKHAIYVGSLLLLSISCGERPAFEQLHRQAMAELRKGQLSTAFAMARGGAALAEKAKAEDWAFRFRVLQGESLVVQGRTQESFRLLEAPAPASLKSDRSEFRRRMMLAVANCRRGGKDKQQEAYRQILELANRAPQVGLGDLRAELEWIRGTSLRSLKQIPEAGDAFRTGEQLARKSGQRLVEARCLNSFGLIVMEQSRFDEAAGYFARALEIAGADDPGGILKASNNLAWTQMMLGEYDNALGHLAKAAALPGAKDFLRDRRVSQELAGRIHLRQQNYEKAGAAFLSALALEGSGSDTAARAQLHLNLALNSLLSGNLAEAREYSRLVSVSGPKDDQSSLTQHAANVEGRILVAEGRYPEAERQFRYLLTKNSADNQLGWLVRANLAELYFRLGNYAQARRHYLDAVRAVKASRAQLSQADSRISFLDSLIEVYDDYVELLIASGRQEEALQIADGSRAQILVEAAARQKTIGPSPVRARELAKRLDSALLFYWLTSRKSYVWLATARSLEMHELPPEKELEAKVAAHRRHILRAHDLLRAGVSEAQELYDTLIGPVRASIPSGSKVIVIPDGCLHQLNFETLVSPGDEPRFWLEDVTVTVAPSLSVLAEAEEPAGAEDRKLLLIGDPVSPSPDFPNLQHVRREIGGIERSFAPSSLTLHTRKAATPEVYRRANPAAFSHIHFAAHAVANAESPLDSAVILSGGPGAHKLYARDVMSSPLSAELVTLSACRSAGARAYAGEGLVGFAWAFLRAGAKNVIAGLWNVQDASTAELMQNLYRELGRGNSPAEALRNAKLTLLHSASAFRKPYHWAPFVAFTRTGNSSRSTQLRAAAVAVRPQ